MRRRGAKIAFFGHFGSGNFGNEATFIATLQQFRRFMPHADFVCICTSPEKVKTEYRIWAVPSRNELITHLSSHNPILRYARKLLLSIPCEIYRWLHGFRTLWAANALVIPGTGLLTDAYTMFNWGPYDLFRWSLTAKLCGCKIFFMSVGAGPVYSRMGRFFIKAALSMADLRSYRDTTTREFLDSIGFPAHRDPVYPDLAFGLSLSMELLEPSSNHRRPVVGLGLMEYAGRYSVEKPSTAIPSAYLKSLADFAKSLLAQGFDIRLLSGDLVDATVMQVFRSLLIQSEAHVEGRVIDEPIRSTVELLSQLAATDLVVATRFHNVLLALVLRKPTIAITFHHKCSSLMAQMGLSECSHDLNAIDKDLLVRQFGQLQQNSAAIKAMLPARIAECQDALDLQYSLILKKIGPQWPHVSQPLPAHTT